MTARLYDITGALAALAAAIYAIRDGFAPDGYLRIGLPAAMTLAMLPLGHHNRHKSVGQQTRASLSGASRVGAASQNSLVPVDPSAALVARCCSSLVRQIRTNGTHEHREKP